MKGPEGTSNPYSTDAQSAPVSPAIANLATTDPRALTQRYNQLTADSAEYNAVRAALSSLTEAAHTFPDAVEVNASQPFAELPEDQQSALMAGRVVNPSPEQTAAAEQMYFGRTVDFIVEHKFGGDREAFDISNLEPRDYGDLVDIMGRNLMPIKKIPKFGEATADTKVQEYLQNVNTLVTLTLASGSPRTLRRALAIVNQTHDRELITGVALQTGADIRAGNINFAELEKRRTNLGSNWATLRNLYLYQQIRGDNIRPIARRISTDGSGKTLEADSVASTVRERIDLHQQQSSLEGARLKTGNPTVEELLNGLPVEQLDFTVLPESGWREALQTETDRIIAEMSGRGKKNVRAEPDRIKLLVGMKEGWDATDGQPHHRKSYLARGTFRGTGKVRQGESDYFDEYIVLVLQEEVTENGQTRVVERVMAESPIAGENALYVFRSDATEPGCEDWHDVFSLPKKESWEFGTRPIDHKANSATESVMQAVEDKALLLLFIEPSSKFAELNFAGQHVNYNRLADRARRKARAAEAAGKSALAGEVEPPPDD